MPRLETQINQIYLIHPDAKKTSLILYEEKLRDPLHLFIILELTDIKKKTEVNELKKISEVILNTFRANQKMPINSLFESTLAQINQSLADVAHKGSKSWLGKFSALIALKSDNEIFMSNTGQAASWIKRKSEFSEILGAEKKGDHPLKTFTNFASGRIREGDGVVMTTTSLFNFVSLELLSKLLNQFNFSEASDEISRILQDSAGPENCFAAFFLEFSKNISPTPKAMPVADIEPEAMPFEPDEPAEMEIEERIPQSPIPEFTPEEQNNIYAPLPGKFKFQIPKVSIPDYKNLLKFSWRWPQIPNLRQTPAFERFRQLTGSGKFFLISFVVFILIFAVNLLVLGGRGNSKKTEEKIAAQTETITSTMAEAESALMYKNDEQAFRLLDQSKAEVAALKELDEIKGHEMELQYQQLFDRINRANYVTNPQSVSELKHTPGFLARAGTGFFFANKDSNTLSILADTYKSLFMLNTVEGQITGINHIPNNGNWMVTDTRIYRTNADQNQFEEKGKFDNAQLQGLKLLSPNRVYVANKATNQILRMQLNSGNLTAPQNVLKTGVNMGDLQDFGVDADVYLLFPNEIKKFVAGNEQLFRLPKMSQTITQATKIFVGGNLYILEPLQKRIIIVSKTGALVNQIIFTNATKLTDFYINETERRIDIIDGNRLLEITF